VRRPSDVLIRILDSYSTRKPVAVELHVVLAWPRRVGGAPLYYKPGARPTSLCSARWDSIRRLWPRSKEAPVKLDSAFAAPNAGGRRAPKTAGLACADTVGIRLTPGVCPACQYQWQITQCLWCGSWSPHSESYVHEARPRRTASASLIFVIIGSRCTRNGRCFHVALVLPEWVSARRQDGIYRSKTARIRDDPAGPRSESAFSPYWIPSCL
jgi:hypothetical protein